MAIFGRSRRGRTAGWLGLLLLLPALLAQECVPVIPVNDGQSGGNGQAGGNGQSGGAVTSGLQVNVRTPSIPLILSIGELVTLTYEVTGPAGAAFSVRAFYDRDGQADTGDEVVFASGLAHGLNRFVQLATTGLSPGIYRVGIIAQSGAETRTAYAAGSVTLTSSSVPSSVTPPPTPNDAALVWDSSLNVAQNVIQGARIPIRFTVSQANFNYRLFYQGITGEAVIFETGTSSTTTVQTELDTRTVPAGAYDIGATVTLANGTSFTRIAPGKVTVYVQLIKVLAPTVGLLRRPGDPVTITVAAFDPASPAARVSIYYDSDQIFGNGSEIQIFDNQPADPRGISVTWNTTTITDGDYWIVAQLLNGTTNPFDYSQGPVRIRSTGGGGIGGGGGGGGGDGGTGGLLLDVTTPLTDTAVVDGRSVRINWTTSLRPGEGTVQIFAVLRAGNETSPNLALCKLCTPDTSGCSSEDLARPPVVCLINGLEATQGFFDFNTAGLVGTYFIGVRLTPYGRAPVIDYAPGKVTVIPKTFWMGNLYTKRDSTGRVIPQTGPFQGAVFKGFNFRDYLGSTMVRGPDFDRDGRNELIFGAQYAKPFLFRNTGRGAGEAYLIYGSASRYSGDYEINAVGVPGVTNNPRVLPGMIFTGVMPNPYAGDANTDIARAGRSIPFNPDGYPCQPFDSEGLRTIISIPDQDLDGVEELVFAFPFCNSLGLRYQVRLGIHPAPLLGLGRLEENGHFLRGGIIVASSRNPIMASRTAVSRHFDRVIQLDEVGQVFDPMILLAADDPPTRVDVCGGDGELDTVIFPCDGFWQDTLEAISPPRLATALPALGLMIPPKPPQYEFYCGELIDLSQIDPPPPPDDPGFVGGRIAADENCEPNTNGGAPFGSWPSAGLMRVIGTGFYGSGRGCDTRELARPLPPYGARILGQTTAQCPNPPTCLSFADRFGHSVAVSGDFLLISAPNRTPLRSEVPLLPTTSRPRAGQVYMLALRRTGQPTPPAGQAINWLPYTLPDRPDAPFIPAPHNYIIEDVGYERCIGAPGVNPAVFPGDWQFELSRPIHIVGAAEGDQIGNVAGLHDMDGDGRTDFAIGAPSAFRSPTEVSPRGAVYVIYRRDPQLEGDYLLEDIARDPISDPNRLRGLLIIGREGENIGHSLAGGGPLNDDYNKDGSPDLLIGCENATTANGVRSGQVFILFGGQPLNSPAGGTTLASLRDGGYGAMLIGAAPGDNAGATVRNAGDFNGDGIADILIAAPNASPPFRFVRGGNGAYNPDGDAAGLDLDGNNIADDLNLDGQPDDLTGAGMVYVVFGGPHLRGTLSLGMIGTTYLPGTVFVGRAAGDALGGGLTLNNLPSHGIQAAGDVDGDARDDILISAIRASPNGRTEAGEVYLIYGFRP